MDNTRPIPADFGIYAYGTFQKESAMYYYRVLVPLKSLYDRGLANIYADDGITARQTALRMMNGSDIILGYKPLDEAGLSTVESIAKFKAITKDGALLFPPLHVFDIDDDVEFTHPLNSSYITWGTRDWAGNPLTADAEDPETLSWPGPDGKEVILWKDGFSTDGEQVFSLKRNYQRLALLYESARKSAGVTVSTDVLASRYREQGCENVYVYPNSMVEDDYFFPELAPHKGVRLLWQGGSSHFEDWLTISDAFVEVMNENPHVTFVSWGATFPWVTKKIRPEQVEVMPWSPYSAYKFQRHCLRTDINLCPLATNTFNEAKSAIKWYEASIGPHPEATLAAKFGPYTEIEHGKTGLLYSTPEEFKENLTALIRNAELRTTLAQRAKDWVLANRDARKTSIGLYEFYQELKRKQRMEALSL